MAKKNTKLTTSKILSWADAHHRRTRKWPRATSGKVRAATGETWSAINAALRTGSRGLRRVREVCRENEAALLLVSHDAAILDRFEDRRAFTDVNQTDGGQQSGMAGAGA